jgi:hypothetical protein
LLRNNRIGPVGARSLAAALEPNRVLQHLPLDDQQEELNSTVAACSGRQVALWH